MCRKDALTLQIELVKKNLKSSIDTCEALSKAAYALKYNLDYQEYTSEFEKENVIAIEDATKEVLTILKAIKW